MDTRARTTTDTVTLTFVGNDDEVAPSVIDVVVTQRALNDDSLDMALRINGDVLPSAGLEDADEADFL